MSINTKHSKIIIKIDERFNKGIEQIIHDMQIEEKRIYDRQNYDKGYAVQHQCATYYYQALSHLINTYKKG
jgi:hypothetical protein